MSSRTQTLLAVGDIIPGPNAKLAFALAAPILKQGDIVMGQLEVPHTKEEHQAVALGLKPVSSGNPTSNLLPLLFSGFNLLTLAGNHVFDEGIPGIKDTIEWLENHNIAYVGVGMNLQEARRSVVIERDGTRFGFLDYNCVGPKETWASFAKPGCAYVDIITNYEVPYATPGGPPAIYTGAESKTLGAMVEDIEKLRSLCDILVVSFHKGLGHTPAKLAAYEQQVAYTAIDAGADLILGHHAHILQGIEVYKGKSIFHGLCNFVTYAPSLAPGSRDDPDSWVKKRRELFGFEPDPDYPTYPFHPEAKYTIIAKCTMEDKKIIRTSFIPCLINKQGQPEILERDARGQEVLDYMDKITRRSNLNAKFAWENEEVMIGV